MSFKAKSAKRSNALGPISTSGKAFGPKGAKQRLLSSYETGFQLDSGSCLLFLERARKLQSLEHSFFIGAGALQTSSQPWDKLS